MATFFSGHQRVFWDLLFTSGDWANKDRIVPSEHTITLVSPWVTDISTQGSGWAEELVQSACSSSDYLGSLSKVLIALKNIGFNIRIVVLEDGKWLNKTERNMLENESKFLETMHKFDIICERRQDMHYKWLCTPVGLWKGSSNSTSNGLFGRLEEQNELYRSILGVEYSRQKEEMEYAIQHSSDYFEKEETITTLEISLESQNAELSEHLLPEHDTPPADSGIRGVNEDEELPEFIPEDYSHTGQIDFEGNEFVTNEESLSMKIWIKQIHLRLKSFIDFVFINGYKDLEFMEKNWTDAIHYSMPDGKIKRLSQAELEDPSKPVEGITTHDLLFRIKNIYDILQCCGIAIDEGKIVHSNGVDANGSDLSTIFSNTLMQYLPIEDVANNIRIDNLFDLVYELASYSIIIANSEQHSRIIMLQLENCIMKLEANYLRPLESLY